MSFNIALSGLGAARSDLEVTGNNIANASTAGFKKSRAEFADIFASNFSRVSDTAVGGGVRVASVAQQFEQGNVRNTGNALDIALVGEGFLVVQNRDGEQSYTRDGAFGIDREGFVVNNFNQRLQVYPPGTIEGTFNTGTLSDLQLSTTVGEPQATSEVEASLNFAAEPEQINAGFLAGDDIDPTDDVTFDFTTSLTVFDSLGSPHTATLFARRTAIASDTDPTSTNNWEVALFIDGSRDATTAASNDPLTSVTLSFDRNGRLVSPATATVAAPDPAEVDFFNSVEFVTLDLFQDSTGVEVAEADVVLIDSIDPTNPVVAFDAAGTDPAIPDDLAEYLANPSAFPGLTLGTSDGGTPALVDEFVTYTEVRVPELQNAAGDVVSFADYETDLQVVNADGTAPAAAPPPPSVTEYLNNPGGFPGFRVADSTVGLPIPAADLLSPTGNFVVNSVTDQPFQLGNGANPLEFLIDFTGTTMLGTRFSVNDLLQDGFTTGELAGIDISDDGIVQARFTNGRTNPLGKIALANFNNPQGLSQTGDNQWVESFESGDVLLGEANASGFGSIQAGSLEESNVDLTEELVNLITAQRNFDANSQVIRTENEVTQTAVNLGR